MSENWLRTDEREDLLASLRMLSLACDQVRADPAAWKWVVNITHNALQSAMAFHLSFGDDLLVAKPEDAQAWLQAHEDGTPYPEMMMDGFRSLYKKIKQHEIAGYRFVPQGTQGGSVRRLNLFRNEFTHFMPKGWSVELSGMPGICLDCIDIVRDINAKALPVRWNSDAQGEEAGVLLDQCHAKLAGLRDAYAKK
jgi:hypothetical protein